MTIKEVAKLANVSTSTISRVVNNSGYVKEDVRKKIEKLIQETGYRPNAHAKALLQNKSHTIGVILPKVNSSSSGDTVAGIDSFFASKGYSLIIGNSNHSIEKEFDLLLLFQEKRVDGIVFIATELTKKHQELIKKSGIPTVILGQESLDSTPCVIFDDEFAAKELTEYLTSKIKKDIAFIGVGDYDIAVGVKRKNGFLKVLEESSIRIPNEFIKQGNFTVESGYVACKEILQYKKPKAIFAVTDKMAIGAMRYLFEKNIKVPQDIAIVGMGGTDLAKYYHPVITTSKYNYSNLGYEGAKLLFDIIEESQVKTKKIILSHELLKGESLWFRLFLFL